MSSLALSAARAAVGVSRTRASTSDRVPVAAPLGTRTFSVAVHSKGCFCANCKTSSRTQTRLSAANNSFVAAVDTLPVKKGELKLGAEAAYLKSRVDTIQSHFPSALSVDDFLFRLEMALCSFGLNGENSIAILNLCRDEATNAVRHKVEEVFPLAFNINGLGGGITCGVTGMGAGLSHSPKCEEAGKQRYVFFSFPHIAINSKGEIGALSRPGQDATSSACGALIAALGQFKAEGLEKHVLEPGVHSVDDPEYSIIKQRIARKIVAENRSVEKMNLIEITQVAERQISSDLEYLISKAVDPKKADYAIVTGVQVHNWGVEFDGDEPNIEFIAPTTVSVVIDGVRTELDLTMMPALSPRMIKMLSNAASEGDDTTSVCGYTGSVTVSDIGGSSMFSAHKNDSMKGKEREERFAKILGAMK